LQQPFVRDLKNSLLHYFTRAACLLIPNMWRRQRSLRKRLSFAPFTTGHQTENTELLTRQAWRKRPRCISRHVRVFALNERIYAKSAKQSPFQQEARQSPPSTTHVSSPRHTHSSTMPQGPGHATTNRSGHAAAHTVRSPPDARRVAGQPAGAHL
jgi:hypothetical protein